MTPDNKSARQAPGAGTTTLDVSTSLAPEGFRFNGILPSAVWCYVNAEGLPLYATARFEAGTLGKRKQFKQYRWEAGRYLPGLEGGTLPLYCQHELNNPGPVLFAEGEKNADALRGLGYTATTTPGGTGNTDAWLKARGADLERFRGRRVYVLPDADAPGRQHADTLTRALAAAGADVRQVSPDAWAHLGDTADPFDWIQEGHDRADLDALLDAAEGPQPVAEAGSLPPVPLHCLPNNLGRYIAALAVNKETSPEMALAAALAVASAAVPATAKVRFRAGFEEIAPLWVAVVAEPGSRKTPVLDALCKPMRDHDRNLWAAYNTAATQHAEQLAAMAKDKHRKHDPKPPAPSRPQTVADDATAEALADVFNDNARFGLGLLWAPDELTGLIGSLNQYKAGKGSDRQTLLKLWSGSPIRVNRRTRQVRVDAPRVAIVGAIQPAVARRLGAQDEADGLLDRIHWVSAGDEGPPRANTPDVPPELADAWSRTIRGLLPVIEAFDLAVSDDMPPPEADARTFSLSADAWQTFAAWYETRDKRTIREAWFRGYAAKLPGQCLRVMLTLHHLKHGVDVSRHLEIDAQTVAAAIELAEWLAMHTAINRAAMAGDFTGTQEARALLAFIRKRGGTATLSEVMQYGPKACRSAEAARKFGGELVEAGAAAWIHETTTAGNERAGLCLVQGGRDA